MPPDIQDFFYDEISGVSSVSIAPSSSAAFSSVSLFS